MEEVLDINSFAGLIF